MPREKFKLKKLIDDKPASGTSTRRFSEKDGGKIVVHSKRHSKKVVTEDKGGQGRIAGKQKTLSRPRRKRNPKRIVIGVFLAILGIVGAVLIFHYYRVKKLEALTLRKGN